MKIATHLKQEIRRWQSFGFERDSLLILMPRPMIAMLARELHLFSAGDTTADVSAVLYEGTFDGVDFTIAEVDNPKVLAQFPSKTSVH